MLITFMLSAQKVSNYEKYWQAREDSLRNDQNYVAENNDLYDQPINAVDTLVRENPNIDVNYYDNDPFFYSNNLGRFYHNGFNFWLFADPYYYDYWMNDWYLWDWNYGFMGDLFWYPWYYNGWYGNGYYAHNNFNYNNHHRLYVNQKLHGENPQNFVNNHQINRRTTAVQQSQNNQNRRAYRPGYLQSYNSPRMSTRPQYNNTRNGFFGAFNRNRTVVTQQRNTQSRTYSMPSRRNYSAPSRSSSSFGSGRSYSSGSSFSGGRSFSGGSSRSYGGSSSGRRR